MSSQSRQVFEAADSWGALNQRVKTGRSEWLADLVSGVRGESDQFKVADVPKIFRLGQYASGKMAQEVSIFAD